MPAPPRHKGAIVRAAATLFRRNGYAATGINEIAEAAGAPKGSLYHYPIRGGDQVAGVTCSPAPPLIAAQIWSQSIQAQMVVRYFKGEPMATVLDKAAREVEGFKRT